MIQWFLDCWKGNATRIDSAPMDSKCETAEHSGDRVKEGKVCCCCCSYVDLPWRFSLEVKVEVVEFQILVPKRDGVGRSAIRRWRWRRSSDLSECTVNSLHSV